MNDNTSKTRETKHIEESEIQSPSVGPIPNDPQNVVVVRTAPYGTNDAANASTAQLRIDPVFNHDPPKILSGNLQPQDVDGLLARGVPALSGPVGSLEVNEEIISNQKNLNNDSNNPSWPRSNAPTWPGWNHSDIKNIALPFVMPVFSQLLEEISE